MWKCAKKEMIAAGVKPMGSYDKSNVHGGLIWGWKQECNLTENRVKNILFACIESGQLTMPQLQAIRKSLSYAYQLQKGVDVPSKKTLLNFSCVPGLWKTIDEVKKIGKSTLPEWIPTPEELKTAFRKVWSLEHPWSFVKFCQGCLMTYDCFMVGPRSREDIKRVKESKDHDVRPSEGQMSTGFLGGRCKSEKKRSWRLFTVCFCPKGKHVSPGRYDRWSLDVHGNPTSELAWSSTCPLACFEFAQTFPKAKSRRYAKVNKSGSNYTLNNEGDVVSFATSWLIAQGVCSKDQPYSHNSGRKSLARLLSRYQIPYEQGFEIHGDKWQNWQESYQKDCPWSAFECRDQSLNPDVACRALRSIAQNFGLGVAVKVPLDRKERLLYHLLAQMQPKLAKRIRMGVDSDDDMSDFEEVPVKKKKKKKKRKRPPPPKRPQKRKKQVQPVR